MRKLYLLLALSAGVMMPLTAVAQDSSKSSTKKKSKKSNKKKDDVAVSLEELTFSDEQAMLNNQAVDAMDEKNYSKAEQLFQAMLQLGEFNITWMNLGKTYEKEGKCLEAAEAYSRVAGARQISDYEPEVINGYTQRFIEELDEKCSARVIVKCTPSDMTISFDGGKTIQCTDSPISLVPGRHSIYGETNFGFNSLVTNLNANETTTVDLEVVDPEKVLAGAGITLDALKSKSRLFKILGYTFIGVGAPTLGAGLGLTMYYWFDYNDKYKLNKKDQTLMPSNKLKAYREDIGKYFSTGYALIVVGSAMVITGVALVVVDAVRFQPQIKMLESSKSAFEFEFAPLISPEFSGFALTGTF